MSMQMTGSPSRRTASQRLRSSFESSPSDMTEHGRPVVIMPTTSARRLLPLPILGAPKAKRGALLSERRTRAVRMAARVAAMSEPMATVWSTKGNP